MAAICEGVNSASRSGSRPSARSRASRRRPCSVVSPGVARMRRASTVIRVRAPTFGKHASGRRPGAAARDVSEDLARDELPFAHIGEHRELRREGLDAS